MQLITADGRTLKGRGDFRYLGNTACSDYKVYEGRSILAYPFLSMCTCDFCSAVRESEIAKGTSLASFTNYKELT